MKITKIQIKRFRGFCNKSFETGKQLTVISWLNWTQKTTILGLLSQPFSITEPENPMIWEKPLSWWNFKSGFSDKFKISHGVHDKAWDHEWTLHFDNLEIPSYTVESILRAKGKSDDIRFWKKGDRSKWSGYIQLPVVYLSLKRLLPIGEDGFLKEDASSTLTADELNFYAEWHNKILILTRERDKIINSSILTSSSKQTLWASTEYYDWKTNSAWQDNLGKILLSILTFRRLKNKYGEDYKGWILCIDEIDTTLYPWSQLKLIDALLHFASSYDIQIFITTHSLTMLEYISSISANLKRNTDVKLVYLKRIDDGISIESNINYSTIKNNLNRNISWMIKKSKIDVYTEDSEAQHFAKSLLGTGITKNLKFIDVTLGCLQMIELSSKKIPSFSYPNSIIILDWDIANNSDGHRKAKKLKNFITLPTRYSPEQVLAKYLNELSDEHPLWQEIDTSFDHGVCFGSYSCNNILEWRPGEKARNIAKNWYKSHIAVWWKNASKVWKYWKLDNSEVVKKFKTDFELLLKDMQSS